MQVTSRRLPRSVPILALLPLLAACEADRPLGPVSRGSPNALIEVQGAGSPRWGTITIVLEVAPGLGLNDPTDIPFVTSGKQLTNFALDDDADPTLSNSITFTRLQPGSYGVLQAPVPPYALAGLGCTSTGLDNNIFSRAGAVGIALEPGESVTCTWTLEPVL